MDKAKIYRAATLAIPLLCCLIAATIALAQERKLRALDEEHKTQLTQIAEVQRELAEISKRPLSTTVPAVPGSNEEEVAFLSALRSVADANHVEVVRWTSGSTTTAASSPQQANSSQQQGSSRSSSGPGQAGLPQGITSIMCSLDTEGPFQANRNFLYALARWHRLFTLSGLHWARGAHWPTTRMSLSVTRYLLPAGKSTLSDPDAELLPHATSRVAALPDYSMPMARIQAPTARPARTLLPTLQPVRERIR